jgi:hypothetical protein
MMNGKMKDVLLDEIFFSDPQTGIQTFSRLIIWADENNLAIIEKVPGVSSAYKDISQRCKYDVFLDPRYDREFVKAEIEAAILIGKNE